MPRKKDREFELRRLYREWGDGESGLPIVKLLLELGREDEAATFARGMLAQKECQDAEELERLLARVERTPNGWDAALQSFAAEPSLEKWHSIIRFAPEEKVYDWTRKAFRQLRKIGCDRDALIRYATQTGITPDVMEMVDAGEVSPDVLVERARQKGAAVVFWLGLASQAAYLMGDRFRAVALMRDARNESTDRDVPMATIFFYREHADAAMKEMMKKAGVWDWKI